MEFTVLFLQLTNKVSYKVFPNRSAHTRVLGLASSYALTYELLVRDARVVRLCHTELTRIIINT